MAAAPGLLLGTGCRTRRATSSARAESAPTKPEGQASTEVCSYDPEQIPMGSVVAGFAGPAGPCPVSSDGPAGSADFCFPVSIAESPTGDVYVAEPLNGAVRVISGREVRTLRARDRSSRPVRFDTPVGVWFSGETLFVCDLTDHEGARIWQVDPKRSEAALMKLRWVGGKRPGYAKWREEEPVLSSLAYSPCPVPDGGFLLVEGVWAQVLRVSPTGEVSHYCTLPADRGASNAGRFLPHGAVAWVGKGRAAVTSYGRIYLVDEGHGAEANPAHPVPSDRLDDMGPQARFSWYMGLSWDSRRGRLLVAGARGNTVYALTLDGEATTIAGGRAPGHADGTGPAASFNMPMGLCTARNGDVLVADSGNNLIRRITPGGAVTTVAGAGKRCIVPLYSPD